jgi:hypothetical protein
VRRIVMMVLIASLALSLVLTSSAMAQVLPPEKDPTGCSAQGLAIKESGECTPYIYRYYFDPYYGAWYWQSADGTWGWF